MIMRSGSFVLACLMGLAAIPPDDQADHQGTWQAVAFVRDGKPTPDEVVLSITRTVEGDHIVWKRAGKAFAGTSFKLDPSTDPKTIDVIPDGGQNRDRTVLGIYKIEGETLTICMADPDRPRPKTFAAEVGDKQTLMTFKKTVGKAPIR